MSLIMIATNDEKVSLCLQVLGDRVKADSRFFPVADVSVRAPGRQAATGQNVYPEVWGVAASTAHRRRLPGQIIAGQCRLIRCDRSSGK